MGPRPARRAPAGGSQHRRLAAAGKRSDLRPRWPSEENLGSEARQLGEHSSLGTATTKTIPETPSEFSNWPRQHGGPLPAGRREGLARVKMTILPVRHRRSSLTSLACRRWENCRLRSRTSVLKKSPRLPSSLGVNRRHLYRVTKIGTANFATGFCNPDSCKGGSNTKEDHRN